jgi:hypothetical protein
MSSLLLLLLLPVLVSCCSCVAPSVGARVGSLTAVADSDNTFIISRAVGSDSDPNPCGKLVLEDVALLTVMSTSLSVRCLTAGESATLKRDQRGLLAWSDVKFDVAFSTATPQSTTGPLVLEIGGGRTINTTAPGANNGTERTVPFFVSDVFAERFIIVVFHSANVLRRIDLMTMREVSIDVNLSGSKAGPFALSSQLGFLRFETNFLDSCDSSYFLRLNFEADVPFAERETASGFCGSQLRFNAKTGNPMSWFSEPREESESSSCSSIKPKSSVRVAGVDALEITKFIQECSHSTTTVFNSAILFLVVVLVM